MAPVIIRAKSAPPSAQLVIARLAMLGFGEGQWEYRINQPLADPSKRTQIRDIAEQAKPADVAHYAEIMKPFTLNRVNLLMPPVVFTADEWLVDGNTRTMAAERLGWSTFHAIVLLHHYVGAPQALLDQFEYVSTLMNTTHGKGLNAASIERLILKLAKDDSTAADLARKTQVNKATVASILYARKARIRAQDAGITVDGTNLTRSHLSYLGMQEDKFTEPVLIALLQMIIDTGMSSKDERTFVARVNALTTEKRKLDLIAAEADARSDVAGGYAIKPSQAAQLRQALGKVIAHEPGELVETNPARYQLHRDTVNDAIGRLQKVYQQQLNLEGK
jgi:hypothetical protein